MKKLRCGCFVNSITLNPECPWKVVSPTNGDCFWRFLSASSDSRGELPEFDNAEIAAVLGISSAKALARLKLALGELKVKMAESGLTEQDFVALSAHYPRGPKRPPVDPKV